MRAFVLLGLAGVVVHATPRWARAEATQLDRWGRVILDSEGHRRLYGERDLPRHTQTAPAAPAVSSRPAAAPEEPGGSLTFALKWHHSVLGTGIGDTGLHAVDLAGDGRVRVVSAATGMTGFGPNDFWYVLGLSPVTEGYQHVWVSTPYPNPIRGVRVAQVDGDPAREVLIATGSQILIYDGASYALERTINTSATEIRGLTVADVDSDGQLELVFCSATALYVYNATTGVQEYAGPGYGGLDVAVGNLDADPALEIVVGNEQQTGYVLGGQTHAVEWANPWGFGRYVRLGDIDGDGRDEVVAGYAWSVIRIFDVDQQSLTASIPTSQDIDALRVLDVEGDGPLEIVYGDGQWGGIHVHNGQSLSQKWYLPNPDHGVTDVTFGDTDGDAVQEVLWGAGFSSTGADHVHVHSAVTQAFEWRSTDINGPFYALTVGRPWGLATVLSGSFESDSGYGDGLYFFHSPRTGRVVYQSPPPTGLNWTGLWRIRSANVDADPQEEVFFTTSTTYTGIIICHDSQTHAEQWRAQIPSGLTFASMALSDVDADGDLEVVAGVKVEHTGAPGVYVYVYNAATGALEWQSPSVATGFVDLPYLRVAQLDADAQPEMVVGATNGAVFAIDGLTHATNHLGFHGITALDLPDRNADGRAEIVIGTSTGQVRVLDPVTGSVLETVVTVPPRIDGLAVADLDSDGVADYVLAVSNAVQVRDGASLALAWSSGMLGLGSLGSAVGANDSVSVGSLEVEASPVILVNIGTSGFKVFRRLP